MSKGYSAARPIASRAAEFGPELYREIFHHSNEPIAIISPEGHYLEQNTAHRDLLGYSDEELLGQTPAIHMGREAFETIVNELAQNGVYRGEVVSHTKNRRASGKLNSLRSPPETMPEIQFATWVSSEMSLNASEPKKHLRRSEAELTDFFENATYRFALGGDRRDGPARKPGRTRSAWLLARRICRSQYRGLSCRSRCSWKTFSVVFRRERR